MTDTTQTVRTASNSTASPAVFNVPTPVTPFPSEVRAGREGGWGARLLCTLLFLCTLTSAQAQYRVRFPLPTNSIPESLGVNIHFTDPKPGEMQQLAAAGFRWIRMDFSWDGIEKQQGRYDFSAYDRLLTALKPYHIRSIFILDYGNDLYEQGPPRTEPARAAFCRFVHAAIAHFRHRGIFWEMWNEPNGAGFWGGKPNVDEYIALALATGKTIRAAGPDEYYIGPAVSGMDFSFMEKCFQAGLLQYWDAVSFHPYRDIAPETAAPDFERVREMITRYGPPGKKIPILSGEWGYSELYPGLDLQKQSRYIAREFLSDIANGLILSIWYDWHDDGTDPKEVEHHFGTVFNDYRPKPAYTAVQTLSTTLNGFAFNKRLALNSPDDYCLLFTHGAETCLVAWTTDHAPHEVTIPASPGDFDLIGYTGDRSTLTASSSGLKITLSDAPQYLLPKGHNALLSLAAAWTSMPPYLALGDDDDYMLALLPGTKLRTLPPGQLPHAHIEIDDLSHPSPAGKPGRILLTAQLSSYEKDAKTSPSPYEGEGRGGVAIQRSRSNLSPQTWGAGGAQAAPPKLGGQGAGGGTMHLDRSSTPHRIRTLLTLDNGSGSLAQDTIIFQRDPLRVQPRPAIGSRLSARVENPSGRPFHGLLELRYGGEHFSYGYISLTHPLIFTSGQTSQDLTFELPNAPARNYSVQFAILKGNAPRFGQPLPPAVLVTPAFAFTTLETFDRFPVGMPPPNTDYQIIPDGDPKVHSEITAQIVDPPPGIAASNRALEVNYNFAPGWKFLQVMLQNSQQPLPGKPIALGMWVYSNGSGDLLRARFEDATGQTFQPDAGDLDWKGWRYVTFSLRGDDGGWWGGAADGVVHYPIHLQTVLLVDSPGGRGGKGSVIFTNVTLVSEQR